jgi:hypothetical protein
MVRPQIPDNSDYPIRILYPNRILRNRIRLFLFFSDIFQIPIVTLYLLSVSDRIPIMDFRIFTYKTTIRIRYYPTLFYSTDGYFRIRIVILIFFIGYFSDSDSILGYRIRIGYGYGYFG